MAEMQDMRLMAAGEQRTSISTAINLLGAAASLALLIGIGVWSYQLLMRDVSGVPVVRAAEGPMRVQPDDPGGQLAQHQGLSVNNVAAEGGAGAPADRLVLAPAPLNLTIEDENLPSIGQADEVTVENDPNGVAAGAFNTGETAPEPTQIAAVEALAEKLADGVDPLEELNPLSDAMPATEEEVQAAIAAVTGIEPPVVQPEDVEVAAVEGGLGRSLRPKVRPATLSKVQAVSSQTVGVRDVDPASIPTGTRLAQLGAYESADVARTEWTRLSNRFETYLAGKDRVIQKATSGGRTFYRLRAMGFEDLSDARRFCSALVSQNAECIPVVTR